MKAADMKPQTHGKVLELCKLAQRDTVRMLLVHNYVGGVKRLAPWDDFKFSLCHFHTWDLERVGKAVRKWHWQDTACVRRYLRELAEARFLETRRLRAGGPIGFRLNRSTCDAMAAEVYAELEAGGMELESNR